MLKEVAITGGICSGKSTVCRFIEENFNYPVFYSDDEAKHLANTNYELINRIKSIFGDESYINNTYNTRYIASIVFNDKEKLNILNEIFRNFVKESYENFKKNSKSDIIFYESALIFEHNTQSRFDYVIGVYVDLDIVRERLKLRNGLCDDEINKRLRNQMEPKEKVKLSNFIINTNEKWTDDINKIIIEIEGEL